jgi:hypothetical protein
MQAQHFSSGQLSAENFSRSNGNAPSGAGNNLRSFIQEGMQGGAQSNQLMNTGSKVSYLSSLTNDQPLAMLISND